MFLNRFCIVDTNAFLFVDTCMDATVGSNDCSHWTLDTYSEFTEISSSNQLQILQSYIPFITRDGCLESVSMILQTVYQPEITNVGQESCVVNCVLSIEANACRRAFLLLGKCTCGRVTQQLFHYNHHRNNMQSDTY